MCFTLIMVEFFSIFFPSKWIPTLFANDERPFFIDPLQIYNLCSNKYMVYVKLNLTWCESQGAGQLFRPVPHSTKVLGLMVGWGRLGGTSEEASKATVHYVSIHWPNMFSINLFTFVLHKGNTLNVSLI